jgi:hypothetical protein
MSKWLEMLDPPWKRQAETQARVDMSAIGESAITCRLVMTLLRALQMYSETCSEMHVVGFCLEPRQLSI